jgi:CRISPR-associated endonuclease/helicase Cas3
MPNDVIIVPAAYGMPDAGQSAPVETLGAHKLDLWEPAQIRSGKPFAMRINRAVLESWCGCPPVEELIDLADDPAREREEIRSAIDAVRQYTPVADDTVATLPRWLLDLLDKVRDGRIEDHPGGGCVLFATDRALASTAEPDLFADDDDLLSAIGKEVTLARHTASVERAVAKIARRCLPDELLGPLRRAAYWHDVGKLDERFQVILRQGDEIADNLGEPLAKSAFVPTSPARRQAIRAAAGLPEGFRHEMLSLQLAERNAELLATEQVIDLVLHLVASHHGHARPFAPVVPDSEAPAISGRHDNALMTLSAAERARLVAPHRLGSGIPDRFWRLTRRYGWWGLAYLEAILRFGDWYGSEHAVEENTRWQ